MVDFLIRRPIAVCMTFLALLLVGIATTTSVPVSLLPDIDIPVITVRVRSEGMAARQLQNSVTGQLMTTLKEVGHVESMKSETRDGSAWVELRFRHGTPIDLASVEVNEKVDKALNFLPSGFQRPEVVKASASDLPIFYLMVYRKNKLPGTSGNSFLDLSNFAGQIIRKRLEQLAEIALVDMNGLQYPQITILPREEYIKSGAFTVESVENALTRNNIDLGNLLIRDGQYQYNIRFNTKLESLEQITGIPVAVGSLILPLGQVAEIKQEVIPPSGRVKYNSEDAVSLAVIKQPNARIAAMEKAINLLVGQFRKDYPDLEFAITRDQTKLLKFSISNLVQDLIIGGLLALLVLFVFIREKRAPWLIGVSVPVALIISMFFFYLLGLTVNVISLSGLVLGVGMMIDNSIIVIDNITQHRERHEGIDEACVRGTNEVIRPLISSVMTTCAVFIPLIFMKGMAGALFYDQAMAVSIGLFVSLVVAITLLPVLYRLIYQEGAPFSSKGKTPAYYGWYEHILKWVLRHQVQTWAFVASSLVISVFLWRSIPVSRFPKVSYTESSISVDWNEPVTLNENSRRVESLLAYLPEKPEYVISEEGNRQYLLRSGNEQGTAETTLHIRAKNTKELNRITWTIRERLHSEYPYAGYKISESENLLNLTFSSEEPDLVARISHPSPENSGYLKDIGNLQTSVEKLFPGKVTSRLSVRDLVLIETDPEKMHFYKVDPGALMREIRSAFHINTVFRIAGGNIPVPVTIGNNYGSVWSILKNLTVRNREGQMIPVSGLVTTRAGSDLKTITAGKDGEYYPLTIEASPGEAPLMTEKIRTLTGSFPGFSVNFSGSVFSNREMLLELLVIVAISILLLWFILAAQFESILLPMIVLVEIPLDMFGILILLKLFGAGINIMSAIGIVVMSGIVINDSILKVDTINKLMDNGYSLIRAIFEGGKRRLKPIIMTSLTTTLAISPFLFQGGMGAELQRPLSLAIIGGVGYGTLVSLFFIPLLYYRLRVKSKRRIK